MRPSATGTSCRSPKRTFVPPPDWFWNEISRLISGSDSDWLATRSGPSGKRRVDGVGA